MLTTMRWVGGVGRGEGGWLVYSLKAIINGSGGHSYVKISHSRVIFFIHGAFYSSQHRERVTSNGECEGKIYSIILPLLFYFQDFSFCFLHNFTGLFFIFMLWDKIVNPYNAFILTKELINPSAVLVAVITKVVKNWIFIPQIIKNLPPGKIIWDEENWPEVKFHLKIFIEIFSKASTWA